MINTKLHNIIDELRSTGGCQAYVVVVMDPGEALVLVVPHGSEGEMMPTNPIGGHAATHRLGDEADWGKVTRPMLVRVTDELPAPRPTLKSVGDVKNADSELLTTEQP
jgi:hypothetical protein